MSKIGKLLSFILAAIVIGGLVFLLVPNLTGPRSGVEPAFVGLPQIDPAGFKMAEGPRQFSFPYDEGPHPDYQTEWWYYTGNLVTTTGRHFGFELTFFRRGLLPPSQQRQRPSNWATTQVYMAHFTLTDVAGNQFFDFQKLERGAAGLAGAQITPSYQVWLDNWSVVSTSMNVYLLRAAQANIAIDLTLVNLKGNILEGIDGYSQKGPGKGNASYYYSQPLLDANGSVTLDGQNYKVTGMSWMDHEFSTTALAANEVGWDWFGLQLSNGSELMLYQIRLQDNTISPYSSGTLISRDGKTTHLNLMDFTIKVNSRWNSPHSGATYPSSWTITIPAIDLTLQVEPYIPDQELNLAVTYWEGASRITGKYSGQSITGQGYVELTGYAGSLNGQF